MRLRFSKKFKNKMAPNRNRYRCMRRTLWPASELPRRFGHGWTGEQQIRYLPPSLNSPQPLRFSDLTNLPQMARKRKRTAWSALSQTRPMKVVAGRTAHTPHHNAIHVQLSHNSEDPIQSFPTEGISQTPVASTPDSPFVVEADQIRDLQNALGMSPDTPPQIARLPPDAENLARNLLASRTPTPVAPAPKTLARRRLSDISTVTPMRLHLDHADDELPTRSPSQHLSPPLPPTPNSTQERRTMQPMSHNHLLSLQNDSNSAPSPITPANKVAVKTTVSHNPNVTTGPIFTTGKGLPIADQAFSRPPKTVFFATGNGKPLDIKQAPAPGFQTGAGRKISLSASKSNPFVTPSPVANRPPFNPFDPPLSNGKSTSMKRDVSNQAPIFTTGKGKPLQRPLLPKAANSSTHADTAAATTSPLRKTLFKENGTSPALLISRRTPNPRRQGLLKSTPFKTPRQTLRPQDNHQSLKSPSRSQVPRFIVPQLTTKGRLLCSSRHHDAGINVKAPRNIPRIPNYIHVNRALTSCMHYSFGAKQFGDLQCLPGDLSVALEFSSLSSFGVHNCLSWINSIFPLQINKPATSVGSTAWTRMSYSLAVWKLAKLQSHSHDAPQASDSFGAFLTAANVVRELLRRIKYEWHSNKQPHLLRMLRKDSSPASHIVVNVVGLEMGQNEQLFIFISDGWYIARAIFDKQLEQRIWNGSLLVGDKISVFAAGLQSLENPKPFFCGEGDEMSSAAFRVSANGARKAPLSAKLGIRRPPYTDSLSWLLDDAGTCPAIRVIILRAYPVFYIESLSEDAAEGRLFVCRREEAEDSARAAYEEKFREKRNGDDDVPERKVRSALELLVCGLKDDPSDATLRKPVRIYNIHGGSLELLSEGNAIIMSHVWPKRNKWTCKPDKVQPLKPAMPAMLTNFPRQICSVAKLKTGAVKEGEEFDGVFTVLHICEGSPGENRTFVYLADEPTNDEIGVLALELSDCDTCFLPSVFRRKRSDLPGCPLVAILNIELCVISAEHDLVHAKATLRSSFLSPRSTRRHSSVTDHLKNRLRQVENKVRGKEPQLDILREAVMSFTSGKRGSIGAYFTGTQDV